MNTYRITARVPWGIERYIVAAPNHLAACALVENTGQPYGQPNPVAILWEIMESAAASHAESAAASRK